MPGMWLFKKMWRCVMEMIMKKKWDEKMVILRLEEAASTLKRLPDDKFQQLKSNWPETEIGRAHV